jgi:uncharacterized membrane protein YphA (DoxX/SURF4 family)
MSVKGRAAGYWVSTAMVAFVLLSGGAAQLAGLAQNAEGLAHLGYPPYLLTILGFWKVLGGIALLAPGFPRLKEWAYAGAFFDLSGAAASYMFVGDAVAHAVWPLLFAVVTLVSWALRPAGRTLGTPFAARAAA